MRVFALALGLILALSFGLAAAETQPMEWMPTLTIDECQSTVCAPVTARRSDEGKCFNGVAAPASNDEWLSASFTLPAGSYHYGGRGENQNSNPGPLELHKTTVTMASSPESGLSGGFRLFNNEINHWGHEGDIWLGDEREWTIYAASTGTWSFCFWPNES